jgi:tRNA dimethylallyltransferase
MSLENAIYLAGPTASGKSAVALLLAREFDAEIISVDSMQVYRGLDIGTAKPSVAEQGSVRHHLIDVAELTEPFDAARFVALAQKAQQEIQARGKMPIFCGGTGLYFKALVSGLGDAPPRDDDIRKILEKAPLVHLQAELKDRDPITYDKIDLQNPRRVIRALEVIRITGRPFSELRAEWSDQQHGRWFGIERDRSNLNARINARVDEMFARGLVDETRLLLAAGLESNQTATQALGYRQIVEHIRGLRDLPATIDLVKIKTRQFAKRQMTWFKRHLSLQWIPVAPADTPAETTSQILRKLSC